MKDEVGEDKDYIALNYFENRISYNEFFDNIDTCARALRSFGVKSKDIVNYLTDNDICVSQKSACSIKNTPSKSIMVLYNDKKRAFESFRISLCELVKKEEIDIFIEYLMRYINGKI